MRPWGLVLLTLLAEAGPWAALGAYCCWLPLPAVVVAALGVHVQGGASDTQAIQTRKHQ